MKNEAIAQDGASLKVGDFVRVVAAPKDSDNLGRKGWVREIIHSEGLALVRLADDEHLFRAIDLELMPRRALKGITVGIFCDAGGGWYVEWFRESDESVSRWHGSRADCERRALCPPPHRIYWHRQTSGWERSLAE